MKKIGIYTLIIASGIMMYLKGSKSVNDGPQPCELDFNSIVDSLVQKDSVFNQDGVISSKEYDEFILGKLGVVNDSLPSDSLNYCELILKLK